MVLSTWREKEDSMVEGIVNLIKFVDELSPLTSQ